MIKIVNIIENSLEEVISITWLCDGDEFGIILPNSDENKTKQFAEKISQNIDNAKIVLDSHNQNIDYLSLRIDAYTVYPKEKIPYTNFLKMIRNSRS